MSLINIYKLERTDDWSYDDYYEFVCYANSEEEAKLIHPANDPEFITYIYKDGWRMQFHDGTLEEKPSTLCSWPHDLNNIEVTKIGITDFPEEPKPGVIAASYHAG